MENVLLNQDYLNENLDENSELEKETSNTFICLSKSEAEEAVSKGLVQKYILLTNFNFVCNSQISKIVLNSSKEVNEYVKNSFEEFGKELLKANIFSSPKELLEKSEFKEEYALNKSTSCLEISVTINQIS